jgi:gp16 family phage-associated protein
MRLRCVNVNAALSLAMSLCGGRPLPRLAELEGEASVAKLVISAFSRCGHGRNRSEQYADHMTTDHATHSLTNPIPAPSLLTEVQAKAALAKTGLSVADWARARGFSPELSRMVLAGKRKCLRGQSHEIAVAFGIKHGATPSPTS